ncbi:hypothetical protein Trydic_g3821 [Trypoxylus dichotomus]
MVPSNQIQIDNNRIQLVDKSVYWGNEIKTKPMSQPNELSWDGQHTKKWTSSKQISQPAGNGSTSQYPPSSFESSCIQLHGDRNTDEPTVLKHPFRLASRGNYGMHGNLHTATGKRTRRGKIDDLGIYIDVTARYADGEGIIDKSSGALKVQHGIRMADTRPKGKENRKRRLITTLALDSLKVALITPYRGYLRSYHSSCTLARVGQDPIRLLALRSEVDASERPVFSEEAS